MNKRASKYRYTPAYPAIALQAISPKLNVVTLPIQQPRALITTLPLSILPIPHILRNTALRLRLIIGASLERHVIAGVFACLPNPCHVRPANRPSSAANGLSSFIYYASPRLARTYSPALPLRARSIRITKADHWRPELLCEPLLSELHLSECMCRKPTRKECSAAHPPPCLQRLPLSSGVRAEEGRACMLR